MLGNMRKSIVMILLLCLSSMTINAQFLFRVIGNGQDKPSYMLGTVHTLPCSLLDSIPAYLEAETLCRQMYVEYDVNDRLAMDSLRNAGMYLAGIPDGKTVIDYMNREQIEMLKNAFKEVFHICVSDSDIMRKFNYQPVAFLTMFKMMIPIMEMQKHPELGFKGVLLDAGCAQRAEKRGMVLGNLDAIQEKDSLMKINKALMHNIDAQVDSLASFLCRFEQFKQDTAEEMQEAVQAVTDWKNGDYDHFSTSAYFLSHAENDYALFRNRNEAWLPKMCVAMSEAPTMFVFGAGHLIGPHGMVQLLRNSGYHVEQIKDGLLTSYNE